MAAEASAPVLLRTVGRIIVIAFAFFLAALAASFVLFTLGLERVTGELHRLGPDNDAVSTSLSMMDQGLALIAGMSIIPALLVIFTGEIARIRSVIYYVAGGGVALAAIPLLARVQQSGNFVMPEQTVWQVIATAGFAGGFVYWLIAGRNA
jgi:hypothetical protein